MHFLLHASYSFVEEWDETKEKELQSVVAESLGSGIWLLGLKALLLMGSMTLSQQYLSVPCSPHLWEGDDRSVLRIKWTQLYKAFRTVPYNKCSVNFSYISTNIQFQIMIRAMKEKNGML